jgi:hypothetical protein
LTVAEHPRGLRLQSHEFLYRFTRLSFRPCLQPLAEEHEGDQERSNLEVEIMHFSNDRAFRYKVRDEVIETVKVRGGGAFKESVLAHNLPFFTRTLMTLGMSGLLVSIPMSLLTLPPRPKRYHWSRNLLMFFQWFLVPIVAFLSAIPAIDSQTRILTKRYFGEFWVTEKMRK